jgi:2-hydroxychromene-2-carboxylate isomerase
MPELLRRRVVPSTIIRLSQIDAPARTAAALRRAAGGRGHVELYFAFDDASSAVAVIELADRLRDRPVVLELLPVVHRGLADDPAFHDKRRYAIADARRLARRFGLGDMREEPLYPEDVAPLAEMAAAIADTDERTAFCTGALRALWFGGDAPAAPEERDREAVQRNEQRMRRRGPYDTPAAVVAGQWFFAHDRVAQILHRLDVLGWT